jgi:hypothetical protein
MHRVEAEIAVQHSGMPGCETHQYGMERDTVSGFPLNESYASFK